MTRWPGLPLTTFSEERWRGLSTAAKLALVYLDKRADHAGKCFPSVERIAADLGLCRNTVHRATTELASARYIVKRRRRSLSVEYHLCQKEGAPENRHIETAAKSRDLPKSGTCRSRPDLPKLGTQDLPKPGTQTSSPNLPESIDGVNLSVDQLDLAASMLLSPKAKPLPANVLHGGVPVVDPEFAEKKRLALQKAAQALERKRVLG